MERLHDGIDYDLLEQRDRKKKKLDSFRRLPVETAKNINEYTGQDILNLHAIVLKNIMWE